ncbi:2-deoxy-D-gluconate 3-dehydrogenase [Aspergillus terreus]|uniref:2-deoxy-D-gluconate 3-dehydrogenase n=1 Tax=Aspergillus terreus TaxID=33178 RepID=A0A5M3YP91_ASPTE|nr:hypothetical protein ATETN484_0001026200 [Aspergillus terreus]GFF12118.1 2-deoxy-D-gluconate 3-dehydrogenase [Aspergillus terreus]
MTLSLAKSGAKIVAITLPNDPRLDTFREGIKNAGQKLSVFEADVADTTSLRHTFKQMWETGITPDILLNCAGINRGGNAEDLTDEDIDAVFSTNLKGSSIAAQEVGRPMLELNQIINVASIISFIGGTRISASAATKGGILQMTKALSNGWAGKGIQVNCICPGYCATPLTLEYTCDKVKNEYVIQETPAGRWGLPEDFRGVVVFLASSASNLVTGTSIVVDGGLIAK